MLVCCFKRCFPKKIDYYDLQAQIDYIADTLLELALSDHREAKIRRHQLKRFRYELGVRLYELEKSSSLRYQELTQEIGDSIAQYRRELEIIIDELHSEASLRESLSAQVNENTASIEEERRVRADAYSAEALARERLAAQVSADILAAVESEATARASGLESEALTRQRLLAQMSEELSASITSEASARATALEAEAITRQAQIAQMNEEISASIEREAVSRANFDEAEAYYRELMRAQLSESINAAITEEARVRANADEAEAEARRALGGQIEDNTAAITNEARIRAAADSAEAEARSRLEAKVGSDISAAIETEAYARASADEAEARKREELAVQVGSNIAAITQEREARISEHAISLSDKRVLEARMDVLAEGVMNNSTTEHGERVIRRRAIARATEELTAEIEDAKKASAEYRLELLAIIDENEAEYERKISSVATDLDAEVTAREKLEASTTVLIENEAAEREAGDSNTSTILRRELNAAIETEQTARTSADEAEARARQALYATVTTKLDDEIQARVDGDNATLGTLRKEVTAAIETEQKARADADSAEVTARQNLYATVTTDISNAIGEEVIARDNAINSAVGAEAEVRQEKIAAIEQELAVISSENTLSAIDRRELRAEIDNLTEASLDQSTNTANEGVSRRKALALAKEELTAKIEEGKKANAGYRLELLAQIEEQKAEYTREIEAVATDLDAETKSRENLAVTVSNNTAAITTLDSVKDGVTARRYVKVDSNGYVAGTELYNGGSGTSYFALAADKFYISRPNAKDPKQLFAYDSTNATLYLQNLQVRNAVIGDGAVTTGKIGSSAVTEAKINNGAVTTDKIAALAVTSAKIADAAITNAKITDATITKLKIGNGQISNTSIVTSDSFSIYNSSTSLKKFIVSVAVEEGCRIILSVAFMDGRTADDEGIFTIYGLGRSDNLFGMAATSLVSGCSILNRPFSLTMVDTASETGTYSYQFSLGKYQVSQSSSYTFPINQFSLMATALYR